MMSLARLCRPCLHRLQCITSLHTFQSQSRTGVKPPTARIVTPQHCQWTTSAQTRHYTKKCGDSNEDLTQQIEELKVMFKDDPQLASWLKEVESDSNTPGDSSDKFSTATELDREMLRYNIEEFYVSDTETNFVREVEEEEQQLPISTQRGKQGVFDIEELVELLRNEGLKDICVIRVPASLAYCDYLVLTTGRNLRHIKAAAHYVNWFFKQKRKSKDPPTCNIEGLQSDDWLAMDIGNIVLHLMLRDTREAYDIETLWTVGSEFDAKFDEEQDPFAASYEEAIERRPQQSQDNLLTLSKTVEYAFEEKPDGLLKEKYTDEEQDMESVTEWHNIRKK